MFIEHKGRPGALNDLHWVEMVKLPKIIGQVSFKEFVHRFP
jgi:hypothetical protein